MMHSPKKHSCSEADLLKKLADPENTNLRKRKHGDDFSEAFKDFSKDLMNSLNSWKTELEIKFGELNNNVTDVLQRDLSKLTETTMELKNDLNSVRGEFSSIKSSIYELTTKNHELSKEVTTLKHSVQFNGDQIDTFDKKIVELSQDVKKTTNMNDELQELKHQNRLMRLEINDNNQRDRLLNLEIVGIPENTGENLPKLTIDLLTKVGAEIGTNDIIHVHRVTPRIKVQGRPRVVIARLSSRLLKDTIISKSRNQYFTTKDLGMHGEPKQIFINEQLTHSNKLLLKQCKEIAKKNKYQFAWAKNGIIRVRKNETSPAITIRDEEDLKKLK